MLKKAKWEEIANMFFLRNELFFTTINLDFWLSNFFKKVACVDSKMFCNFIAVTLQQNSFLDQINSSIAHLFHFALWCRWCPFKHVKNMKEKFFFRLKYCLFCQKLYWVSRSAQRKFEFLQKSRICTKIACNFGKETTKLLQMKSIYFFGSFFFIFKMLETFSYKIYLSRCNWCLIL